MAIQMEAGHQCPITMTNAAVPVLLQQPEIAKAWLPKVLLTRLRQRASRRRPRRRGVTIGMGMTEKQGGTDVRANSTTAEPVGNGGPGGGVHHHGAQVVHVGAHVRRLPGAGAGAGRAHLLPDAALPARRHRQRAALPAPQGQARQPLQRLLRGRVPGGARLAHRRGGARRAHHHRDGDVHAARLRGWLRRPDAPGARQRRASLPAPHRVPEAVSSTSR